MLTHNRFKTYSVLIFTGLNKAQIYKMPYRDSPHHEIKSIMIFIYFNLLKPNEHTEDFYNRRPNDKNFLFEVEDKIYVYMGETLFSFETTDKAVKYSSEDGFNDIKFPFAYGEEKIYFMLHQKYIPIQEYKTSKEKSESDHLYQKDGDL